MRIGIDVGGTHTDAVILEGDNLVASIKALTSADVASGILDALRALLDDSGVAVSEIEAVMIGTTQFTNAVVERRELAEVAAVRLGLPSGRGLEPMMDWPDDIAEALGHHRYMLKGGQLYDGWPLAALDEDEVDELICDLVRKDIHNVAISSPFSPVNPIHEQKVAQKILAAIPDVRLTQSYQFGRLGLLERENAALLNTALLPFADRVVNSFNSALKQRGFTCPMFISQNDGTLMNAEFVRQFPALTFASGPTNSLRGACKLSGLQNAIVVDIGGTTSDIGILQDGFPRESNVVVNIGGVRTNFRMPDIIAVGLGGGSIVSGNGNMIGPKSVGHNLVREGLVFGGDTLTTTDLVVAAGKANVGDRSAVASLDSGVIENGIRRIHQLLNQNIEMMKPNSDLVPVVLVGGGALLVTGHLNAASEVIRPENAGVANAIGAAIAQIGGETETMVSYKKMSREAAMEMVKADATKKAIAAGADPVSVRIADIEETVVPYMEEGSTRVRIKVIGDIAALNTTRKINNDN